MNLLEKDSGMIISSNLNQVNYMYLHMLGVDTSVVFQCSPMDAAIKFFGSNVKNTLWSKMTNVPVTTRNVSLICLATPMKCFSNNDGSGNNLTFSLVGKYDNMFTIVKSI